MNFVDSFFWQLVFQFLEPEDLVAVAGVCYSWWILVFRGSCRKLIMSKVRELDIADTENFYQKLPLQMFVRIRSLNLSGTTISSENFFLLATAAKHLRVLQIERCENISEDAIFRAKDSLQSLESVNISYNSQFGVLAIACLCSYESIMDICFDGISLESREILFLNKTFPRLRNGDIEIYSQEIGGDYFWDAADIVGEAFSDCSYGNIALLHYAVCFVPLFLVMVSLPFIYWKAYRKVSQNMKRTGYFTDTQRKAQKSVRRRFSLIVFVFALCWMPNFLDGFHDVYGYFKDNGSVDQKPSWHYPVWLIEASINPLQGFLNCLVYGQHRPFTACCTHIFGHCRRENYPHCPPDDLEERNKALTINSLSGSVKIPVSEISRLLAGGSERGTPPLRTPPVQSPGKPFTARLLGESRYSS